MVQLYKFLLKSAKIPIGTFMDSLRLTLRAGHGGNGLPKYGGMGGQGGCIYFIAKEDVTLRDVARRYKDKRINASNGEDSSKVCIVGRRGLDVRVEVPVGVQVLDTNGRMLGDLNEQDATCIAAGGGMGGCTGTNYIGKPGDQRTISLDLKLIADVGLVGFPNAGKSTLLKAISNAKPKIAAYPFTTIRPQIGTIEYPDLRSITIADLPGLIEGAHANIGLGHRFLKHVERTRLLLLMVDIFGFRLSAKHEQRNCLENVYALNKELELYNAALLEKPCVLLLNKMDMPGAVEILKQVKPKLKKLEMGVEQCPKELRPTKLLNFERIIPISAKNVARINEVKKDLRQVLDDLAAPTQVVDQQQLRARLQHQIGERAPKIT